MLSDIWQQVKTAITFDLWKSQPLCSQTLPFYKWLRKGLHRITLIYQGIHSHINIHKIHILGLLLDVAIEMATPDDFEIDRKNISFIPPLQWVSTFWHIRSRNERHGFLTKSCIQYTRSSKFVRLPQITM